MPASIKVSKTERILHYPKITTHPRHIHHGSEENVVEDDRHVKGAGLRRKTSETRWSGSSRFSGEKAESSALSRL